MNAEVGTRNAEGKKRGARNSERGREEIEMNTDLENDNDPSAEPNSAFRAPNSEFPPSPLRLSHFFLLPCSKFQNPRSKSRPLILEKAPNVRFSQIAGIFITEFPRPESQPESGLESKQVTGEVTGEVIKLLGVLSSVALGRVESQFALKLQSQANFRDRYLLPALEAGPIERTIPEKPNSRLQKYRLTPKGRSLL